MEQKEQKKNASAALQRLYLCYIFFENTILFFMNKKAHFFLRKYFSNKSLFECHSM